MSQAARFLVHLAAGWRDWEDLETLARLPDGTIDIDILAGAARHDRSGPIPLRLAAELRQALEARWARKGVDPGAVEAAGLVLRADTGAVRTDRNRIVHFDFDLEAWLRANARELRASRREAHVWHAREPE